MKSVSSMADARARPGGANLRFQKFPPHLYAFFTNILITFERAWDGTARAPSTPGRQDPPSLFTCDRGQERRCLDYPVRTPHSHPSANRTPANGCRRQTVRRQRIHRAALRPKASPGFVRVTKLFAGRCSVPRNSVLPTGTDRREAMICGLEGPRVVTSPSQAGPT